jgi:hypothetical protein
MQSLRLVLEPLALLAVRSIRILQSIHRLVLLQTPDLEVVVHSCRVQQELLLQPGLRQDWLLRVEHPYPVAEGWQQVQQRLLLQSRLRQDWLLRV